MIKVQTVNFGEVETTEEDILTAASAIPGFPNSLKFFIIDRENIAPFRWLQSLDDPALTFVIVEPAHFFHDYVPRLNQGDIREIGFEPGESPTLYTIVVLPKDLTKMTANLRGPLIFNPAKKLFKQVFLDTDRYGVRESIVDGIKRKEQHIIEQQRAQQGGGTTAT